MQQFRLPRRRGAAPIAYYVGGSGSEHLVLANGLGGPVAAFRHQIAHFAKRFRVVTWDYRGLYGSRSPARIERLDVTAQAEDLERVLDAVGATRAVFVGWSMGVQVTLELLSRTPSLAQSLVLMSGAYRRPFEEVRLPAAGRWLGPVVDGVRMHSSLVSRIVARASQSRRAAELVRRLRVVSPNLGAADLLALAREFSTLDFDVYLRTLRALNEHDASRTLARIAAPTLVVAGARDLLFPPRVARELVRRLPKAELCIVDEGTHYAPAEFPALVNARIDRFLAEAAQAGAHARTAAVPPCEHAALTDANASARLAPVP